MTTPATMNSLMEEMRERFESARRGAAETGKIAPSSWGAGYDQGYSDALGELLEHITGDAAVSSPDRGGQS